MTDDRSQEDVIDYKREYDGGSGPGYPASAGETAPGAAGETGAGAEDYAPSGVEADENAADKAAGEPASADAPGRYAAEREADTNAAQKPALYSETVRKRKRKRGRVYTGFIVSTVCAASILGGLFLGIGLSAGFMLFHAPPGHRREMPAAAAPSPVQMSPSSRAPLAGGGEQPDAVADAAGAIQKVREFVVAVTADQTPDGGVNPNRARPHSEAGSGVIFSQDGSRVYIVTNYHGIGGAGGIQVVIRANSPVAASLVDFDEQCDLAVISVSKSDLVKQDIDPVPIAVFADSDSDGVGQRVLALGASPDGGSVVTDGIISAKEKAVTLKNNRTLTLMQTTAIIGRDNSGGPLIDMSGRIIGINSTVLQPDQYNGGLNCTIPSNNAVPIIQSLLERVNRPVLGVEGTDVPPDVADKFALPQLGAYVLSVARGTPADKAGIRADDIIASFDDKPVLNMQQLVSMVRSAETDKDIDVGLIRDGNIPVTVRIVLKKYSDVND